MCAIKLCLATLGPRLATWTFSLKLLSSMHVKHYKRKTSVMTPLALIISAVPADSLQTGN